MNKALRYINVKKPLAPQIQKSATDPDSIIDRFDQKKKADTVIKKIDKDYMSGLSSSEMIK